MRIFKHKTFHQWAKKEKLADSMLIQAIEEISQGLVDASLGSGLYKKRIAMPGQGKRGSYRTLLAFKTHDKAFFLYGFCKNQKDNIDENEKKIYKKLAIDLLTIDEQTIKVLINTRILFEVEP
jgi:hypothetical protein